MNNTSSALSRTVVACLKRSVKRCWGRPDSRLELGGLVVGRGLTSAPPLSGVRDSPFFVSRPALMGPLLQDHFSSGGPRSTLIKINFRSAVFAVPNRYRLLAQREHHDRAEPWPLSG